MLEFLEKLIIIIILIFNSNLLLKSIKVCKNYSNKNNINKPEIILNNSNNHIYKELLQLYIENREMFNYIFALINSFLQN